MAGSGAWNRTWTLSYEKKSHARKPMQLEMILYTAST